MDIQAAQPTNDDQELAKVLAGISKEADAAAPSAGATPAPADPAPESFAMPPLEDPAAPAVDAPAPDAPLPSVPVEPEMPAGPVTPAPVMPAADNGELDSIKKEALGELRPLVDKLNVSPEEKFDTYLLLLRSTDDKALIAPAHDAAKGITDETRRAQALLDIIKEIDYLSGNTQQPA